MAIEKHILSKTEKKVMETIYQASNKKSGECLISPYEIFEKVNLDIKMNQEDLEESIRTLEIDEYFTNTIADRKGEKVYCLNLTSKGKAFARNEKTYKINILIKVLIAVICGAASGLAAWGIKTLLGKLIHK